MNIPLILQDLVRQISGFACVNVFLYAPRVHRLFNFQLLNYLRYTLAKLQKLTASSYRVLLILSFLLCGCTKNSKDVTPKLELPDNWHNYSTAPQNNQISKWWLQFNDPVLNELIGESLKNNSDIELAMNNVATAQAQFDYINSYRFPQINMQGSANRTKNSKELKAALQPKFSNSFGLAAVLNYEIDLWGAAANASDSARRTLLASEYSKDAVRLTIISNVAIGYFNLLALDKQIYLTEKLIEAQTEIYKLTQKLYNLGVGDLISASEAASELALTASSLPPLKQQRQEQETALKILVGRSPDNIVNALVYRDKPIDYFPTPPILPTILPSQLLEQRPDIKAAEQNLLAADSNLKAIRATYFPQISLTGLLGVGSVRTNSLFVKDAETWQIGGTLAGPLFDFGKTKANVEIAESLKRQYVIQYKATVREAFGEVVNALSAEQTSGSNFNVWQQNKAALTAIFKLAQQRYKHGNIDYLTVLTAKQNLLQNEIDGVTIKLSQLSSMVNIFHALGGDW